MEVTQEYLHALVIVDISQSGDGRRLWLVLVNLRGELVARVIRRQHIHVHVALSVRSISRGHPVVLHDGWICILVTFFWVINLFNHLAP